MIKAILAIMLFLGFCFSATSQNEFFSADGITVTHNNAEVSREGREYYIKIQNDDYLNKKWGFNIGDTNIACINGNAKPPFECESYFRDSVVIVENTAYLYTTTTIRYIIGNEFIEKPVKARLKLTATTLSGEKIMFAESKNMLYIALVNEVSLEVKIELSGPEDCKWRNASDSNSYAGKWASALDVFDAMPTDSDFLIFTSFSCENFSFFNK